jgi:hypothetical protein
MIERHVVRNQEYSLMVTTVTTTTVTTVTTITAASLALIAILTLLALLIQKEVISGLDRNSGGSRLKRMGKLINIAIIPLIIAFFATLALNVFDVLN